MRRNSEKGNAFLFILIGVVMFAALAMTVTRSMRSQTTSGMSAREMDLDLSDMLAYGQRIERAVDRLRRRGCSENEITFEENAGFSKIGDGTPFDYTNVNSPDDYTCHVFRPEGGGVKPQLISKRIARNPDDTASTRMHPQSFALMAMRVLGHGDDTTAKGTDLVLWLGFLTDDACNAVNAKLGVISAMGGVPPDTANCSSAVFTGSFPSCSNPIGDMAVELTGQKAFCVALNNGALKNVFMQVLMDR